MPFFDIALIIIILVFGFFGMWGGLVKRISALAGLVVSIFVSTRYFTILSDQFVTFFGWSDNTSKTLAFLVMIMVVGSIASFIINKIFGLLKILPLVGLVDRIFGFLLGIIGGVLLITIFIFFLERFPFSERILEWMGGSFFVPILEGVIVILLPLIPNVLEATEIFIQRAGN
jgi:uncharacterized membrane protein required for colicin V production